MRGLTSVIIRHDPVPLRVAGHMGNNPGTTTLVVVSQKHEQGKYVQQKKTFYVGEVRGRETIVWDAAIAKCRWACDWIKHKTSQRNASTSFGAITAMSWYIGNINRVYFDSSTVTEFKNGHVKSTMEYLGGRMHGGIDGKTAAEVIFSDTGKRNPVVKCWYTNGVYNDGLCKILFHENDGNVMMVMRKLNRHSTRFVYYDTNGIVTRDCVLDFQPIGYVLSQFLMPACITACIQFTHDRTPECIAQINSVFNLRAVVSDGSEYTKITF